MASTYTTNKSIEKPANGDYVNTWSTPVNSDWDIIDASLGGTTTLNATGASGTVTLSTSQYRPPTIIITGVLTANVTYRIPSGVGGHWVVYNNTSGSFTITVDSGGGGTSTVIPQGFRVLVYSDGTNIGPGITSVPLAAAGNSGEIQFNSSGSLAGSSNFTYDGTGNVVLGGTTPGRLDVKNAIRIYGATSGYFGLTVPAAAGSQTYTLPNADGTSGQVLTTNGSGTLSWTTASGGVAGVTSFSAGTTGLTPAAASTGAVVLAGTLAVANGGTGQTTYTNGQLLIGNSTGNTLTKATLTAGTGITITNGAGSITISAAGGTGDVVGPASAVDNAIVRFDGTTGKLVQNSGVTISDGGVITTTADASINGVSVGKGAGSGASNIAIGASAATSLTTGGVNTAVGAFAINSATTASYLTGVGYNAIKFPTGANNTALGAYAMQGVSGSAASGNVAVGSYALEVITSGTNNTAVGHTAGDSITSGTENTIVGATAGQSVTTAQRNTLIGYGAGDVVNTGSYNTLIGRWAGIDISSGNYNSALGELALGISFLNTSNCTGLGAGAQVTGNDQVQLGNGATNTYYYNTIQARSDMRDKAEIQDTDLGLNFIMALRPRKYKWDLREMYRAPRPAPGASQAEIDAWKKANSMAALQSNGTHKRNRFHQGLIAQEVKQVMDQMGVDFGGYQDHKVKGGDDVLSIGYDEMIAPLIKAIQELKAEFDEYKRTHP